MLEVDRAIEDGSQGDEPALVELALAVERLLGGADELAVAQVVGNGFAELDDQERYDYRAADADGVVLAVRKKDNDPFGDLTFWSGALDAHLRRQGSQAVDTKPIESADGVAGRQLRFQRDLHGRTHAFWVTVFVTDAAVITVEAGGDEAFFADKEKSIVAAIRSVEAS